MKLVDKCGGLTGWLACKKGSIDGISWGFRAMEKHVLTRFQRTEQTESCRGGGGWRRTN